MRGLFHATPRWRRGDSKSIRANKAFSCSVSGGVNTRSKPRMWRETFSVFTFSNVFTADLHVCQRDQTTVPSVLTVGQGGQG